VAGRTIKPAVISKIGVNMKTPNFVLYNEARDLVSTVDLLSSNTDHISELNSKDCYDLAEKLERAFHLFVVLGDRKTQEDLNKIPINEGVPF